MTRRTLRSGLTLVEVATLIGLAMVLFALILPAVQWARERSRALRCQNQLRSLALALQNYTATHQCLPSGIVLGNSSGAGWSPLVMLLPYLDRSDLYNEINFEAAPPANNTVELRRVAAFLCPSLEVIRRSPTTPGPNGYPANMGSGSWTKFNGLFINTTEPGSLVRWRDVTDGQARTAAFTEWLPTSTVGVTDFVRGRGYFLILPPVFQTRDDFLKICMGTPLGPGVDQDNIGLSWLSGFDSLYNHQLQPNQRSCFATNKTFLGSAFTAASQHAGGVHCAFADGHVEWVADTIDLQLWRSMGSRDGTD